MNYQFDISGDEKPTLELTGKEGFIIVNNLTDKKTFFRIIVKPNERVAINPMFVGKPIPFSDDYEIGDYYDAEDQK